MGQSEASRPWTSVHLSRLYAVILLAALVGGCGTPSAPRPAEPAADHYSISVDFLKVVRDQCVAVSRFTNHYPKSLRVSGDIRFLDRSGQRVSNVPLLTQTVDPGGSATTELSLMHIYTDQDMTRCRAIASYRVKVSLCRAGDGKYLESRSCVGEFGAPLTW